MRDCLKFYIGGEWVEPINALTANIINPATGLANGRIALGAAPDVDCAVAAARGAFASWAHSSRSDRLALFARIIKAYRERADDLANAVSEEMGAPLAFAHHAHVPSGLSHLETAYRILENFTFEELRGPTMIQREPIGVCGLITPWNWPLNQIVCKVAPALAVGCTMVLKPSEIAPFSGHIFAEILDTAGVPAGVFNLVHGDGQGVGAPLSAHPDVDMISITGSTRAGVAVARAAASTVKRVHQELGGKSPNVVLDDASLPLNVSRGVKAVMRNSGQTCSAPTRMLVPVSRLDEAAVAAAEAAAAIVVGDPRGPVSMGPVVSQEQFDKIQELIRTGIGEGATLLAGGVGRPNGLYDGFFVKPTIFTNVTNDMTIAREEVFGPVVTILPYQDLDDAVRIANDTDYGLAAYVNGEDLEIAGQIASRLRAGQVSINFAWDDSAPFGGFKQSGNGRECGDFAFHEFLEIKAVMGWPQAGSARP